MDKTWICFLFAQGHQKKIIQGPVEAKVEDQIKRMAGGSPRNLSFARSLGADRRTAAAPEGVKSSQQLL